MNLHLEANDNKYQIQRLDLHSVTINNKTYTNSIILMPKYLADWGVKNFESLEPTHFQQLYELLPEVVLLGTGQKIRFPAPKLLAPLLNKGIGVEVMDTAAASRTYTILTERQVVAALLFD